MVIMIKIKPQELEQWIYFLHQNVGIYFDTSKDYLFETRLSSLIKEHNCKSFAEFLILVRKNKNRLLQEVINCMTTQETSFFRDGAPFDTILKSILPSIL